MCFQIPKQVKSVSNNNAIVEGDLIVKLGNLKVTSGDYVLVYGNIAVEKIDRKKALSMRKTINMIDKTTSSRT